VSSALKLKEGMEAIPGCILEKRLGSGGWGDVWKAARSDGTFLALKFLHCDSQSSAGQELRALQALRHLKHPNLIQVEQVWSCAGYVVISMELAEGSLLDLLEISKREYKTPIGPAQACHFMGQAALALDFLNTRQHLVNGQLVAFRHCDVKPSNILFKGSMVKLADFSLAVKTSSPLANFWRLGTPCYSAPEVFQGRLSQQSDLYALAVTYCLVRGGRLPFPDPPLDITPCYLRPAPDLTMLTSREKPIIAKGLAQVPQDRWPTCSDMMRRLSQCNGLPTAAPLRRVAIAE
jgi:serine/threonine protein kinase, bacterial